MKKLYRLKSNKEMREKLLEEFSVSENFIYVALAFRSMSKLAKAIRARAQELGAPSVIVEVDE